MSFRFEMYFLHFLFFNAILFAAGGLKGDLMTISPDSSPPWAGGIFPVDDQSGQPQTAEPELAASGTWPGQGGSSPSGGALAICYLGDLLVDFQPPSMTHLGGHISRLSRVVTCKEEQCSAVRCCALQ